jgi:hypothetical protein
MRRADELLYLGVLGLDLRDDVADRLVDQRKPDLLGVRHEHRIGQRSALRARQAIWNATTTSRAANSLRNVAPESDSASTTPP